MSEQLIEGQGTDVAKLAQTLRDMATRIETNGGDSFGGCFVVLPPQGHEALSTLILDTKQDPAQFYGMLKTKCDIALAGIEEAMRNAGGFGRR